MMSWNKPFKDLTVWLFIAFELQLHVAFLHGLFIFIFISFLFFLTLQVIKVVVFCLEPDDNGLRPFAEGDQST